MSNNGAPGMSWLGPWSMRSSTPISCRNWTACSMYHGPCSTPTLLKRLCRAVVVTPDPDGVVLLSRIELGWLLRSGKQMADQVGVALGQTWVCKTFSWPLESIIVGSYGLVSAGVLVAAISSATCLTCLCGIHVSCDSEQSFFFITNFYISIN